MITNRDIFDALRREQLETEAKLVQFNEAVMELSKLNGSGEGVRKAIRNSVEKAFLPKSKTAKVI